MMKYRPAYTIAILLIVYAVGIAGLTSTWRELFLGLTPVNLCFTAFLLFLHHRGWNKRFLIFLFLVPILAWLIELAGVKTGILFGHYHYGKTLGPGLWDIPFVIGLNWLILIYAVGSVAALLPLHRILRIFMGALAMVLLDLFIEPVAIRLDFWQWEQAEVPIRNYLGWFITSLFLLAGFEYLVKNKENRLAPWIYGVQMLFFVILSLAA